MAKWSLTLWGSEENLGYLLSNVFRANPSVGCLNIPSFSCSLSCHIMSSAILNDIYILSNLAISGKYLKTLAGFPSCLARLIVSLSLASVVFHLKAWQILHFSFQICHHKTIYSHLNKHVFIHNLNLFSITLSIRKWSRLWKRFIPNFKQHRKWCCWPPTHAFKMN